MKTILSKTLSVLLLLCAVVLNASAEEAQYKLFKHTPNDGGILYNLSADGKWAIINLGTTSGGSQSCSSQLWDTSTGEHFTLSFSGRELSFSAASNVDADGIITIVGSMNNRPMAAKVNVNTKQVVGTPKFFANRTNWNHGSLTAVTPDGKYAIGHYTEYAGTEIAGAELNGDYWYDGLFVNIETGEIVETPGTPKGDRNGRDQHAMKFSAITPDGKYILGEREWYIPSEGFPFIYSVEAKDFTPIGFSREGNIMKPKDNIEYIDFPVMSPNGRYIGGTAITFSQIEGTDTYAETKAPFRYDMETKEMSIFDDNESQSVEVGCIDNNGTIFGNPDTGTPLRNFRIFYQDKYWIPFSQICQQIYGFNFSQKTGFEFSGTALNVSADGRIFIAFSDPQGESYSFDFGAPVEEICSKFDLLSNYIITPKEGSTFSELKNIEINFGRAIQVVGKGNTHLHLYKADGTKVRDGLSTESGLQLKAGSKTTVIGSFRTSALAEGEKYYVVLDPGAVAVAADATMTNRKEIRVNYAGRKDGPVQLTKIVPESGKALNHLDGASSYVQLTFDCPVQLTESYEAYLERIEEGGNRVRIATLTLASGNTEETKNQILVYPTSTIPLYEGVSYNVVVSSGSISDYSGSEKSYNEEIVLNYDGTFVREVSTESLLFADTFNDPNSSLSLWLNYEGDHRTPLALQQSWGFNADNTPWNFSTHDIEGDSNYYATSHSLYAPSGESDDWMMTPQLRIPADGKALLQFYAMKLNKAKDDHLWIYAIPEERNIAYLNDANMAVLKNEAELIDEITDLNASEDGINTANYWKHYSYKLDKYAGKDIYIAFVNKNNNQSCVFVDNVSVEREILYGIGFSNDDRVVNLNEIALKGNFTIKTKDFASGAISLVLKDAEGNEVSRIEWPNISGTSIVDRPIPMNFPNALPLTVGIENNYTITINFNGKDTNNEPYVRTEVYKGSIFNLAFRPTKRVVLEELTGTTCPNCPQGIISIDACVRQYKDQFIPISIHAYDGDALGPQFAPYAQFLGLNGAPSARINRIDGIFYPMYGYNNKMYYDLKEEDLWYNIVAAELEKPALCDIAVNATLSDDKKNINFTTSVKYAINAEEQTSLFFVVLEDGIPDIQENNFANSDAEGLGEWGLNGMYGTYYAYPVIHNDVVRSIVGDTFAGSLGLLPSTFEAGKEYTTDEYYCRVPDSVIDMDNLKIAAILIDTQKGTIINADVAKLSAKPSGIESVSSNTTATGNIYNTAGIMVGTAGSKLPAGIYIHNGKKMVVK